MPNPSTTIEPTKVDPTQLLVENIRKRIEKSLNKDHPNGKNLKVTLGGPEYQLVHEHAMRGIAPPGLNVSEIQHEFLMKTGKNLGGVDFIPDTANA